MPDIKELAGHFTRRSFSVNGVYATVIKPGS